MKFIADTNRRMRLYVIHHAGGSSAFYRRWGKFFPEWIEVRFLDFPGRLDSQEGEDAQNFAFVVASIQRQILDDGPGKFSVFGHSMGALVGYAALCELEKFHVHAQHLIVSASRSPASVREQGFVRRSDLGDDLLLESIKSYGSESLKDLLRLSSTLATDDLPRKFLELVRRDYRALESAEFNCASRLSCPITAFAGAEDKVDCATMASWAMATANDFRTRVFEGGHFYIERSPRAWAQAVTELLQPLMTKSYLKGKEDDLSKFTSGF